MKTHTSVLLLLGSAVALSPQKGSTSVSRRGFGRMIAEVAAGCTSAFICTDPAFSKTSQEDIDKENILKGYARLNYLLDNWEAETTVCGVTDNPYQGKNGCERNPVKVMEYLGYKSMKDPLFNAGKTMRRLEVLVPNSREIEFIDAVEQWNQAADEANGMAFISSWGEANPGGGKDRVELFIERARKNVLDARSSLATIIDVLELDKS